MLNPLGAAVLEALSQSPLSTEALLDLLRAQQSDVPTDDATLENHLHHHLQQLQELGLIEPQS